MHLFIRLVFISTIRWNRKLCKGIEIVLLLLFQTSSLEVWNWDTKSLVTYGGIVIMVEETWLNSDSSETFKFPYILTQIPKIFLMLGRILDCFSKPIKSFKICSHPSFPFICLSIQTGNQVETKEGRTVLAWGSVFRQFRQRCLTGFYMSDRVKNLLSLLNCKKN